METIMYGPQVKISNVESLPSGTGSRYLEVMRPHQEGLPYVAVCWRRKVPAKAVAGRLVVEFPKPIGMPMKSKAEFVAAYQCVLTGYVLQALVVGDRPSDFQAKGLFVQRQLQAGESLLGQMYDYIQGLTPAPLEAGSVEDLTDALIKKVSQTHPDVKAAAIAKLRAAFGTANANGVHK